jgi:hypothetical protein
MTKPCNNATPACAGACEPCGVEAPPMPDIDAAVIPEDVLQKCGDALNLRWTRWVGHMNLDDITRTVLHAADYPALQARVAELEGLLRAIEDANMICDDHHTEKGCVYQGVPHDDWCGFGRVQGLIDAHKNANGGAGK